MERFIIMKRIFALVLTAVLALAATGCSEEELNSTQLVDGTYRAEYAEVDAHGWKDYVEVMVVDGELNQVIYDAENADGTKLKSEDQGYKSDMENFNGTYPAKYSKDLINQFIESGKVSSVDIVAGATESTEHFKTLIVAAMQNAIDGDTEVTVIEE